MLRKLENKLGLSLLHQVTFHFKRGIPDEKP